jgi:hypothetical protein
MGKRGRKKTGFEVVYTDSSGRNHKVGHAKTTDEARRKIREYQDDHLFAPQGTKSVGAINRRRHSNIL